MLARLADRAIGMVSIALLARLLAPSDFGLVAIAAAVIAGTELFRAFSFEVALIQNQEAARAEYDTVWTLNARSEEHTSELQSLMRISYAVFCLKKKTKH